MKTPKSWDWGIGAPELGYRKCTEPTDHNHEKCHTNPKFTDKLTDKITVAVKIKKITSLPPHLLGLPRSGKPPPQGPWSVRALRGRPRTLAPFRLNPLVSQKSKRDPGGKTPWLWPSSSAELPEKPQRRHQASHTTEQKLILVTGCLSFVMFRFLIRKVSRLYFATVT